MEAGLQQRPPRIMAADVTRTAWPRENTSDMPPEALPGGDPQNKGTCNGIPEKGLEKIAGKPQVRLRGWLPEPEGTGSPRRSRPQTKRREPERIPASRQILPPPPPTGSPHFRRTGSSPGKEEAAPGAPQKPVHILNARSAFCSLLLLSSGREPVKVDRFPLARQHGRMSSQRSPEPWSLIKVPGRTPHISFLNRLKVRQQPALSQKLLHRFQPAVHGTVINKEVRVLY